MKLVNIYEIGRSLPIGFSLKKDEKKLKDIYFEYDSKEVVSTALVIFIIEILLYLLLSEISNILGLVAFFFGTIFTIVIYVYPTHIYYSQMIMAYNEEMFQAILSISNFISMNSSLEYAFFHTRKVLKGILRIEFDEIIQQLHRKEHTSFGGAIEPYIQKWNEVNLTFVKSLRLLETAIMAEEKQKETIIQETITTLLVSFKVHGKRSSEELAQKAKGLISFGVLLPVMSLMLLPLLSIFMSDIVKPSGIFFFYNVLFPTVMLLVALDFANKRVQINTIDLQDSSKYKKTPHWIYLIGLLIIVVFSIPGFFHLATIDMTSADAAEKEYDLMSVIKVWLIPLGIMVAIYVVSKYYVAIHRKQWEDVKLAEDDLPHLLQIFGTFISLNISIENIIPYIARDYKEAGFKDHPVVNIFSELSRKLIYTKGKVQVLIVETLHDICPSKKVSNMLSQILSFSEISQESASKATRLIRNQTIAVMELDDYIRTLLAETSGLINISVTMLLPLLSAVAVIMSILIVKAIDFITKELSAIQESFGGGGFDLSLVDITKIIPPTLLEVIISIYFIEMFYILSLFATKIEIGNDRFKFAQKLSSNMMGFLVYSMVLIGGHLMLIYFFFEGLM
ncbi:MAG: hypothetical protein ACQESG_06360 [Nanobdellota archaeon]